VFDAVVIRMTRSQTTKYIELSKYIKVSRITLKIFANNDKCYKCCKYL